MDASCCSHEYRCSNLPDVFEHAKSKSTIFVAAMGASYGVFLYLCLGCTIFGLPGRSEAKNGSETADERNQYSSRPSHYWSRLSTARWEWVERKVVSLLSNVPHFGWCPAPRPPCLSNGNTISKTSNEDQERGTEESIVTVPDMDGSKTEAGHRVQEWLISNYDIMIIYISIRFRTLTVHKFSNYKHSAWSSWSNHSCPSRLLV